MRTRVIGGDTIMQIRVSHGQKNSYGPEVRSVEEAKRRGTEQCTARA